MKDNSSGTIKRSVSMDPTAVPGPAALRREALAAHSASAPASPTPAGLGLGLGHHFGSFRDSPPSSPVPGAVHRVHSSPCPSSPSPSPPRTQRPTGPMRRPSMGLRRGQTVGAFTKTETQTVADLEKEAEAGYHGFGANKPRKYIKGDLKNGHYHPHRVMTPDAEYKKTCQALGAEPNSHIQYMVTEGFDGDPALVLGETWISLHKTYLGEKGFLALLPLLDRNCNWTSLDASNNGLRNEAVLHLVDLLLRPPHRDRDIFLDLSGNPISETGGRALLELAEKHPHIGQLSLRRTKVPRRISIMIRRILDRTFETESRACFSCGMYLTVDAKFCKNCGKRRVTDTLSESDPGDHSNLVTLLSTPEVPSTHESPPLVGASHGDSKESADPLPDFDPEEGLESLHSETSAPDRDVQAA